MKAGGCVDRRSKRDYTTNAGTSSSKVSLETEITGIFLHADMTADILMQLEGNIEEFIMKLETRLYQNKYVTTKMLSLCYM